MVDKLMESDIELLLVRKPHLIVDNPTKVERQVGSVNGTIDMLIEDSTGTTYIVELKRHRADHGTIAQVSRYYEALNAAKQHSQLKRMIVAPEVPIEIRIHAEEKGILWRELGFELLSRELGRPLSASSVTHRSVGTGMILREVKPCMIDGTAYRREPAPNSLKVYRKMTEIWEVIYGNKPVQKSGWIYYFSPDLFRGKGRKGLVITYIDQPTTYLDSIQFYMQYLPGLGIDKGMVLHWHEKLIKGIDAAEPMGNDNNGFINVTVRNIQMDHCITDDEYELISEVLQEIRDTLAAR